MPRDRAKILMIRGGAMGDFILTLPALAALRNAFPETHLEVLGYPKLAELALAGGLIDGYRSVEARPLAGFFAKNGKLDPSLCDYFNSFSLIVSYLYDPDAIFRVNIALCSKAQYIQGPHRPNENEPIHASAIFLRPLEKLAIFDADPIPRLALASAEPPLLPAGDWLAAHPGSGSEKKNWPEKSWLALVQRVIVETTWNILLVGGEAEGDRLARFSKESPSERIHVAQNRPLVELARTLRECSHFIGHDSGVTHIAAALGIPTLVLWGESDDQIWKPLHPQARILKPPHGLAFLSTEEVFEALKPVLLHSSFAA